MRRHRTTARGIVFSLLLSGLAAAASASPSSGGSQAVPRLVFPLVAETALWDNYGDSRDTHPHAGIDMENPWRAPVVAVEAGKVSYATSGLGGCMLYLHGRSGTMYMYIHLNNDLTAKNDNRGDCKQNDVRRPERRPGRGRRADRGTATPATRAGTRISTSRCTLAGHRTQIVPAPEACVRPLFAARPGSALVPGLRGTSSARAPTVEPRSTVSATTRAGAGSRSQRAASSSRCRRTR
jgi:hypothetical protein